MQISNPIAPSDVLHSLLTTNFKPLQCVDEGGKLRQQHSVLLNLISQYQSQIHQTTLYIEQQSILLHQKQRLLQELQLLKEQRSTIDSEIAFEMKQPVCLEDNALLETQLRAVHGQNARLRLRIRDVTAFVSKLELMNEKLERSRIENIRSQNVMVEDCFKGDWRQRVEALRVEMKGDEEAILRKAREREVLAIRSVEQQEREIQERNQRRIQQFRRGKNGGYNAYSKQIVKNRNQGRMPYRII